MLRTVPETINEEVDLYIRTYYSLLRSTQPIRVRSLEETHAGMRASLHPKAEDPEPDVPALVYAAMRLPTCMYKVKLVLLGQSDEVFLRRAGVNVGDWQRVFAAARRRKLFLRRPWHAGGLHLQRQRHRRSDPDSDGLPDRMEQAAPALAAHGDRRVAAPADEEKKLSDSRLNKVRGALGLSESDFRLLQRVWQDEFFWALRSLATEPADLQLNLLAGSAADYRQAVQAWWRSVIKVGEIGPISQRPIYFISSNPHALPNLLNGFARQQKAEMLAYLQEHNPDGLWQEWQALSEKESAAGQENLLYYLQRSFLSAQPERYEAYYQHERQAGHPSRR
jgi:hypothetical protein